MDRDDHEVVIQKRDHQERLNLESEELRTRALRRGPEPGVARTTATKASRCGRTSSRRMLRGFDFRTLIFRKRT